MLTFQKFKSQFKLHGKANFFFLRSIKMGRLREIKTSLSSLLRPLSRRHCRRWNCDGGDRRSEPRMGRQPPASPSYQARWGKKDLSVTTASMASAAVGLIFTIVEVVLGEES